MSATLQIIILKSFLLWEVKVSTYYGVLNENMCTEIMASPVFETVGEVNLQTPPQGQTHKTFHKSPTHKSLVTEEAITSAHT